MELFYVTVDYRTRAGSPATWCGMVEAAEAGAALETATNRIRNRKRHPPAKIDGGTARGLLIKPPAR